jgi:adenosyl cobinamide kinase/adenosyl cobinamide phosphate guanylyltransferase
VPLTLLLGGARSGKSALAVELGRRHQERHRSPVVYLATAPAGAGDEDLDERIRHHRGERPTSWATIESEIDLIPAMERADGATLILDCLTLWVSNVLLAARSSAAIQAQATLDARFAAAREEPTVVVSNEVGLGVHPPTELGREYRDLLGRVNRTWAAEADTTLFLAAGRAVPLVDPLTLLP